MKWSADDAGDPDEYHDSVRSSFIKDLYERYLWYAHYVKGEGPASPPEKRKARIDDFAES
jgi:hypothetical protein